MRSAGRRLGPASLNAKPIPPAGPVTRPTVLNDLYSRAVEPERLQRLISLFRLDFTIPSEMRADVAGKPVYLGLAMAADATLKLKAQNLLLNLPLAARQ